MMRINKKGLTLVELIAVLIVLILIFLLAITKVTKVSDETEKKAVKGDAISYVKAVNDYFSLQNGLELYPVYEGFYDLDALNSIGIKVDGTKPTGGYVVNLENKTIYACLKYKERRAIVKNNVVDKVDTGNCTLDFKNGYDKKSGIYNAGYTGGETVYSIPKSGKYLVEVWGAQGGNAQDYNGGYGGYSKGYVNFNQGDVIYIHVGGKGKTVSKNSTTTGGYNGGGNISTCQWTSSTSTEYCGSGGGATHIAFIPGLLNTLSSNVDDILIVAGGGGGAQHVSYSSTQIYVNGGSGGGSTGGLSSADFVGVGDNITSFLPSQYSAGTIKWSTNSSYSGSFGKGSNSPESGGGGGFYGGAGTHGGSQGGSGYIGNDSLTDKAMYCYNCNEDIDLNSKTFNIDRYSENAVSKFAKVGDGYARLILVEESSEGNSGELSNDPFETYFSNYQKVEYVKSDGNQYIATNVTPTDNYGIRAVLSSQSINSDLLYFGTKTGDNRFWVGNVNGSLYFGHNGTTDTKSISSNTTYTIKFNYNNDRKFVVDDTVVKSNSATLGTQSNVINIFCGNNKGSPDYKSSIKLYEFEITNGSHTVANYVPCYHKTLGTVGLCDLVGHSFYSSLTSTPLEKGPDVS